MIQLTQLRTWGQLHNLKYGYHDGVQYYMRVIDMSPVTSDLTCENERSVLFLRFVHLLPGLTNVSVSRCTTRWYSVSVYANSFISSAAPQQPPSTTWFLVFYSFGGRGREGGREGGNRVYFNIASLSPKSLSIENLLYHSRVDIPTPIVISYGDTIEFAILDSFLTRSGLYRALVVFF